MPDLDDTDLETHLMAWNDPTTERRSALSGGLSLGRWRS
jgi:hypothetical protein